MTTNSIPSIQIETGLLRIAINNDPNNVIEFDPTDADWVDNFYQVMSRVETRMTEFSKQADVLESNNASGSVVGLPANSPERIALVRATCTYFRGELDTLFGEGMCQRVFSNTISLEAYTSFLEQLTPIIAKSRNKKLNAYAFKPNRATPSKASRGKKKKR